MTATVPPAKCYPEFDESEIQKSEFSLEQLRKHWEDHYRGNEEMARLYREQKQHLEKLSKKKLSSPWISNNKVVSPQMPGSFEPTCERLEKQSEIEEKLSVKGMSNKWNLILEDSDNKNNTSPTNDKKSAPQLTEQLLREMKEIKLREEEIVKNQRKNNMETSPAKRMAPLPPSSITSDEVNHNGLSHNQYSPSACDSSNEHIIFFQEHAKKPCMSLRSKKRNISSTWEVICKQNSAVTSDEF